MKLSAAFVVDQLKKTHDVFTPRGLSKDPCLVRPSLYSPEIKIENYIVYVMDENSMKDLKKSDVFPENCLILTAGDNVETKLPYMCIVGGSVMEVFASLQEMFEMYDLWQENLMYSFLEGKSIQTMLSISMPVLQNSLIVAGLDFSILASSYAIPFQQEQIFGSSESTHSFVTDLKNNELYYKVKDLNGAFYFPKEVTGLASLCVNIKQNGKTIYRLLMLEDSRPIKKSEGFLLEFLAFLIEHILSNNSYYPGGWYNIEPPIVLENMLSHNMVKGFYHSNKALYKIFKSILTDKTADYLQISQKLDVLGWSPNHEYTCFYLEMTELDKRNFTYNPIIYYLSSIFSNCCAFPYNENIVVYVDMTLSQITREEMLECLERFTDENYLNAGVSRTMEGHISLRRQYIQASIALSIGSSKFPKKQVNNFNDVSFYYILKQATKILPGYMVCHEKLLLLRRSDKDKGTEYMKTLRIYLDNQCNVMQTSKQLFIHRSTVLYRLDKIKQILGSDLKDPDEILYLMLSFRLLDMEEVKNNLYTI